MKRRLNWWLAQVMDAFYAARDMWRAAMESATNMFAGDVALWRETNPMPRLKDFLIAHAYKNQMEMAA